MFLFRERSWEITCWKVLKVLLALFSLFFLKIYLKNFVVHIAICLPAEQCIIINYKIEQYSEVCFSLISDLTWSNMTSYRNPMLCITLTMLLKWLRRNWGSPVSWIQKVSVQWRSPCQKMGQTISINIIITIVPPPPQKNFKKKWKKNWPKLKCQQNLDTMIKACSSPEMYKWLIEL